MGRIVRGLMANDTVKLMAITGKDICETARELHGLSRVCTAALGRSLLITDMMGAQLKSENDKLTTIIKGGGPAGNIGCTADNRGHVKGYIENPKLELPLNDSGKLDVSMAVGWFGELTVVRDLGLKEPYVGTVDLMGGEIAEDVAAYYVESEQIPSACGLGVLIDRDRSVLTAGGYLIQLLPGAGEDVITKVEGGIYAAPSVTNILKENPDPAAMLKTVLSDFDMEILSVDPIEYRCYCSRERTERALLSLGSKDLEQIVEEQGGAELSCQFCDKVQTFTADELRAMIADLKARGK